MPTTEVRTIRQKLGKIEFYCEMRGSGPTVVLIPSGEGDCACFDNVSGMLADEFTVFTLDMRGCSRTVMPPDWNDKVTAENLANDVAGLVNAFDLAPATFWGCGSGGQACLALGLYHHKIVRNLIIHEPAVTSHSPLSGPSMRGKGVAPSFLRGTVHDMNEQLGPEETCKTFLPKFISPDPDIIDQLDQVWFNRMAKNWEVWANQYLDSCERYYTDEDCEKINRVQSIFCLGVFSPAWLIEAGRRIAVKCGSEVVWMPCMHYPEITHPELMADIIREEARKNL